MRRKGRGKKRLLSQNHGKEESLLPLWVKGDKKQESNAILVQKARERKKGTGITDDNTKRRGRREEGKSPSK